jgi:hypothetical protein
MIFFDGTEKSLSYPPQSSFFMGVKDERSDVLDFPSNALRVVTVPGSTDQFERDAFGRFRTSQPVTLNDYKFLYLDGSDFNINVSGSGTISYNFALAESVLSIGGAGGTASQQSKMYHNYMPGKSQLILCSFAFGAAVSGVVKRVGYFDQKNGLYLRQNGDGTLSFVVRTNTSGAVLETEYNQQDWNGEQIDWLDQTKTQILLIDFQWLGVGRIRFGFNHNGRNIVAHEVYNSNVLDVVYIANPNLPLRYEVAGDKTASIKQICSTVASEGGYTEVGRQFSIALQSAKTVTTAGLIPIISIRLKNSFSGLDNRAFVRYLTAATLATTNNVLYEIVKLPSSAAISTASWVSAGAQSAVEYDISATTYSTASVVFIDSSLVAAGGQGSGNQNPGVNNIHNTFDLKKNFIAQNFDSTNSEIYVLLARSYTDTATIISSLTWKEVY